MPLWWWTQAQPKWSLSSSPIPALSFVAEFPRDCQARLCSEICQGLCWKTESKIDWRAAVVLKNKLVKCFLYKWTAESKIKDMKVVSPLPREQVWDVNSEVALAGEVLLLPPGFLAIQVCALGICYCSLSSDMAVDKTAEKHFPKCGVGARWFDVRQVFRTCSGSMFYKGRNESAPKFLKTNPKPPGF